MSVATRRFPRLSTTAMWFVLAVLVELLLLSVYYVFTPAELLSVRYALYPFVWINVGLWAVVTAHTPESSQPPYTRALAAVVAVGYFLVLGYLTGLFTVELGALTSAHTHGIRGWQVTLSAPGWGPRIAYVQSWFHVYLVPYLAVGYLSLSYLVYLAVLGAARAAVPGLLGLVSCVGCSFPLISTALATLGGSATLVSSVSSYSTDLSVLVFVVSVGLLLYANKRQFA